MRRRPEELPRPGGGRDREHAEAVGAARAQAGLEHVARLGEAQPLRLVAGELQADEARRAGEVEVDRRPGRQVEQRRRPRPRTGVTTVASTCSVAPSSHETSEERLTVARTRRRSPAGSLPTGQIDPERILTGTRRPLASTTETLASDSPTGAVVTAASASGEAARRAPPATRP